MKTNTVNIEKTTSSFNSSSHTTKNDVVPVSEEDAAAEEDVSGARGEALDALDERVVEPLAAEAVDELVVVDLAAVFG